MLLVLTTKTQASMTKYLETLLEGAERALIRIDTDSTEIVCTDAQRQTSYSATFAPTAFYSYQVQNAVSGWFSIQKLQRLLQRQDKGRAALVVQNGALMVTTVRSAGAPNGKPQRFATATPSTLRPSPVDPRCWDLIRIDSTVLGAWVLELATGGGTTSVTISPCMVQFRAEFETGRITIQASPDHTTTAFQIRTLQPDTTYTNRYTTKFLKQLHLLCIASGPSVCVLLQSGLPMWLQFELSKDIQVSCFISPLAPINECESRTNSNGVA